jgi:DNA polymerase IV
MAGDPVAQALCRDCLVEAPLPAAGRCRACGSPRLIANAERNALTVAHVDCDAFYATIEKRDDPSLADKPVIVGGGKRGVVSTACYVARTFGVRSAMPMFKALAACPHAVVIRPNMEKYARVSRQVRETMRALTPLVEPISIDEAFLDLAGTERLHHAPPIVTLLRFARSVEKDLGVTVSIGLSHNKFLAKIASDLDKPRGFSLIGKAETLDFLATKPVSIFFGIGKVAEARLARAGLRTVADIRRKNPAELFRLVGNDAERLHRLAHGQDTRAVRAERETKTISAETTFDTDISLLQDLEPILWRLSERLSARMKKAGVAGHSITLKLKTADFKLRTRSRSGLAPTQLAGRLFKTGRALLAQECDGTRFRLIGIGASDLCDAAEGDRGDLADTGVAREAQAERAVDKLRNRFGDDAVVKGISLRGSDRE